MVSPRHTPPPSWRRQAPTHTSRFIRTSEGTWFRARRGGVKPRRALRSRARAVAKGTKNTVAFVNKSAGQVQKAKKVIDYTSQGTLAAQTPPSDTSGKDAACKARQATVRSVRAARGLPHWVRQVRASASRLAHTGRRISRSMQQARGALRIARIGMNVARVIVSKVVAAVVSLATPVLPAVATVIGVVAVVAVVLAVIVPGAQVQAQESQQVYVVGMGDDYPWASQVRDTNNHPTSLYNTVNPHTRYYYGNCTDFVFWRVNRDMGATVDQWRYTHDSLTPHGGNGELWGAVGNMPGWQIVTNPHQAQPGDVISFQTGAFGHNHSAGHVAYIAVIGDSQITTENYGEAQYYLQNLDYEALEKAIKAGSVVIKHNPELVRTPNGLPHATSALLGNAGAVMQAAKGLLGLPYGRGRGVGSADCCWTVYLAYQRGRHITLPMSVPGNPWATAKCEYAMYSRAFSYGGSYVPATLDSLQAGDILFFQSTLTDPRIDNITHVALYAGGGMILDAIPSRGVSIRPLNLTSVDRLLPQAVRVP